MEFGHFCRSSCIHTVQHRAVVWSLERVVGGLCSVVGVNLSGGGMHELCATLLMVTCPLGREWWLWLAALVYSTAGVLIVPHLMDS